MGQEGHKLNESWSFWLNQVLSIVPFGSVPAILLIMYTKTALCRLFSLPTSVMEMQCFTSCSPSCHLLLWILLVAHVPKAHRLNHRLSILWSSVCWLDIKSPLRISWQSQPFDLNSFNLLHLLYHPVYRTWVGGVISPSFSQLLSIWNPVMRLMIVKAWLKSEPESERIKTQYCYDFKTFSTQTSTLYLSFHSDITLSFISFLYHPITPFHFVP